MTEKREMTSRREAFSILGLAALGLAVMPNLLRVSEAEAQTSTTTPPPQTGTQRRQERRTERTERRVERRTARQTGRTERRQARQGKTPTTSLSAPQ